MSKTSTSSCPRGSRRASRSRARWRASCTRSSAVSVRRWGTAAPRRLRPSRAPGSSASPAPGCASRTRTTSRSRRTLRITAGGELEGVRGNPEVPAAEDQPVLVVDLGGQYSQLIARRVREARVYSELVSHRAAASELRRRNPVAIVLSGGPASVYADGAPRVDPALFDLGVPTLGICYGMQLMAQDLGGRVAHTGVAEFGRTVLRAKAGSALFGELPTEQTVWMSHRDSVVAPPAGARVVAGSPGTPIAAFEDAAR